jgi:hypothetical protein
MSKTVLDPSCGRGEFLVGVAKRMLAAGNTRVLACLYAADTSDLNLRVTKRRLEHLVRAHGNQLVIEFTNLIHYNSIDELSRSIGDMKFDVVVGNPPYQAPKKGDYSYWARFVAKGNDQLNDGGYLGMVIPSGWMSPTNDIRQGQRSVLRDIMAVNDTKHVCIDPDLGKRNFPGIGQTFTWFVLQKSPNLGNTSLDLGPKQITVDLSKLQMLPKMPDEIGISIIRKITAGSDRWDFTRYIMSDSWDDVVFDRDGAHPHARINGNSNHLEKVVYTSTPCRLQSMKKVVLPYNGTTYSFVVDDGQQGCTNAYYALLSAADDIDSAITYFNSSLMRWLGKNKFTQYNEGALINSVTRMPLTPGMRESDIHSFYQLDAAEIAYLSSAR